ncbi:MAG: CopG family transcriptional regulator [Pseudaminobacter sp.]|nr:CopG family transcriptional regulator [Pseudaminobacter sp.]
MRSSEAERRVLKERIAEADKGVFISAEAMDRWIESWGTENELPPPEPDVFLKPRRS